MSTGEGESPSQDQKGTPIADEADLERQYQSHKQQFEEWKTKSKHLEGTPAYQQYVDQFQTWEKEVEKRRQTLRTRIAAQRAAAHKKFEEAKAQTAAAAQKERERVAAAPQTPTVNSGGVGWVNVSPPDNSPGHNVTQYQTYDQHNIQRQTNQTLPDLQINQQQQVQTVATREQAGVSVPPANPMMFYTPMSNPTHMPPNAQSMQSMNSMMNMMSQMMEQMHAPLDRKKKKKGKDSGDSGEVQTAMMMTTMMSMLMMDPAFQSMPQAQSIMAMMNEINGGSGALMAEGPVQKCEKKRKRKLEDDNCTPMDKKKMTSIKEPTAPLPILSADYGYGGGRGIWGTHDNMGTSRDPMYHKWGLRAAPAGSAPLPQSTPVHQSNAPLPFPLPANVPPPPGWVGGGAPIRRERRAAPPPTEYRDGRPGFRDFSMR